MTGDGVVAWQNGGSAGRRGGGRSARGRSRCRPWTPCATCPTSPTCAWTTRSARPTRSFSPPRRTRARCASALWCASTAGFRSWSPRATRFARSTRWPLPSRTARRTTACYPPWATALRCAARPVTTWASSSGCCRGARASSGGAAAAAARSRCSRQTWTSYSSFRRSARVTCCSTAWRAPSCSPTTAGRRRWSCSRRPIVARRRSWRTTWGACAASWARGRGSS